MSEAARLTHADVGFVFALARESAGLVDLLPEPALTVAAGIKYHQSEWKDLSVVIVECGTGQDRAAAATETLIQTFRPRLIISAGFAGGLVESLERNRVVIPKALIHEGKGQTMNLGVGQLEAPDQSGFTGNDSNDLAEKSCKQVLPPLVPLAGLDRFATGTLLTVDRVVNRMAEKKSLGKQHGASLVDMETWSVAEVCRDKNVPFLPVRVIIDPVNEELPVEVRYISKTSDSMAELAGALFGAFIRRPSAIMDAYRLKENALVATDALGKALIEILNDMAREKITQKEPPQ
ncbi:MAG: hypothetical protein PHQ75_05135 [Thermoguttaceae bacterium]|nr:hypothetical protein [Thermoguttaceae bacterium]